MFLECNRNNLTVDSLSVRVKTQSITLGWHLWTMPFEFNSLARGTAGSSNGCCPGTVPGGSRWVLPWLLPWLTFQVDPRASGGCPGAGSRRNRHVSLARRAGAYRPIHIFRPFVSSFSYPAHIWGATGPDCTLSCFHRSPAAKRF